MTSSNITNRTENLSLEEIDYQQFLEKDVPAVTFLTLLVIVGTIGNIHTLLVYSVSPVMKKLGVRVFILWLSGTDLIACVACIPFEICDIRFSFTFSSEGACKFFRFLNHAVTLTSAGVLTAIAIERLKINSKRMPRRVGKPFIWLNVTCTCIAAISVCLSIPAFGFYGLNKKETHGDIFVTDCTILSQYQNIKAAGLYAGVVILLSTVCFLVSVVIYGKILYMICTQMKRERERLGKANQYQMNLSTDATSKETQEISTLSHVVDSQSKSGSLTPGVSNIETKEKSHKRSKYEKGRQLTKSLIVATGISYLGYLIYVATIMVKLVNPQLYENSIRPATAILLRAYFINNAVNPVVFCLLDVTFRNECKILYKNGFSKLFSND